jgi:hypothetical protein
MTITWDQIEEGAESFGFREIVHDLAIKAMKAEEKRIHQEIQRLGVKPSKVVIVHGPPWIDSKPHDPLVWKLRLPEVVLRSEFEKEAGPLTQGFFAKIRQIWRDWRLNRQYAKYLKEKTNP